MRGSWSRAVLASGALSIASACSNSAPPAPVGKLTVKLVQNPWDASRLDIAVADLLLTEQLGMNVDVTETDEFSQWAYFASGAEHACLEVWPSGHTADIASYIDTGKVENGGPLGPVGKIGWYVPTYLLTQLPEVNQYSFFRDSANTVPFETTATRKHGKGQLLSGEQTWTSYDSEIIANLGLNLELVYAGTEEAELTQLAEAYENRRAILLYLWNPHAALVKYELTPVELPPYSAECYAKIADGGVACDYPPDPLFKIFWPGLKAANPRAYALLKSLTLTAEDQIAMLNLVDNHSYSLVQAAKWWLAQPANAAIWKTWIPP